MYCLNTGAVLIGVSIIRQLLYIVTSIRNNITMKCRKSQQTNNVELEEFTLESENRSSDNTPMAIQTADGQFTSYDISVTEYNNTVMYGSADGDGVLKDGELNIAVPVSNMFNPPDVGIATYKDGKLVSLQKAQHNGYPYRFIQHQITVDTSTTDTIKIFVWDNLNFAPIAKNGLITIAD